MTDFVGEQLTGVERVADVGRLEDGGIGAAIFLHERFVQLDPLGVDLQTEGAEEIAAEVDDPGVGVGDDVDDALGSERAAEVHRHAGEPAGHVGLGIDDDVLPHHAHRHRERDLLRIGGRCAGGSERERLLLVVVAAQQEEATRAHDRHQQHCHADEQTGAALLRLLVEDHRDGGFADERCGERSRGIVVRRRRRRG